MTGTQFLMLLESLSGDDLTGIKGIGPNISASFLDFIKSDRFLQIKNGLKNLETKNIVFNIKETSKPKVQAQSLPFSGQKVVITGTFEISREVIRQKVEDLGGSVSDIISSNTTILFAGQKAGSKLEKAREKGVKIFENLEILENPKLL